MALGTIGAAIAGGLASGAASAGLGSLFGGGGGGGGGAGTPTPVSGTPGTASLIRTPGFRTTREGVGRTVLERRGVTNQALQRLNRLVGEQSGALTGLLEQVRPGFSQIREARLGAIENARTRAISNLSENLQRRRVLGSSFGQDALSRAEAEFGQAEAEAEAASFLEELDVTNRLLEQRFQTNLETVTTELNQANFEAKLAAQLSGAATQALTSLNQINASLAQSRAKLALERSQGIGQFFEPAISAIGSGVSGLFGGGTTGSPDFVTPTTTI